MKKLNIRELRTLIKEVTVMDPAKQALAQWAQMHDLVYEENYVSEEGDTFPAMVSDQWEEAGQYAYLDDRGNLMINTDAGFVPTTPQGLLAQLPRG